MEAAALGFEDQIPQPRNSSRKSHNIFINLNAISKFSPKCLCHPSFSGNRCEIVDSPTALELCKRQKLCAPNGQCRQLELKLKAEGEDDDKFSTLLEGAIFCECNEGQ
jgi:hypothetical protein